VPGKPRFVALTQRVRQLHPRLADPAGLIAGGLAAAAFEATGWREPAAIESPLPGRRGAIEHLLHLRRAPGRDHGHDR